jgi:hypothetical protein
MPIFDTSYYSLENEQHFDTDRYRTALDDELGKPITKDEKASILQSEAIEITRHITDGIRDLIKQDKRIRNLVLNQGAVPLATWTESLDKMATFSLSHLRNKILEMKQDLENGKVEGFPATLFFFKKPSFTTLEDFYQIVFEIAEDLGVLG